jgi:hypothetical protein
VNEILDRIYGTSGAEKTASEGEQITLSDLALALVVDESEEKPDLEKVASAHDHVLQQLVAFDRAGRAMAHSEFSDLEKLAAEGNTAPLEAFFADVEQAVNAEREALKDAVRKEIERRAGG